MSRPRLLFSATVSLDGFMAGPDGDMSWLAEHFATAAAVHTSHTPTSTTMWSRVRR